MARVHVSPLPLDWDETHVRRVMSKHGNVAAVVMKDGYGSFAGLRGDPCVFR